MLRRRSSLVFSSPSAKMLLGVSVAHLFFLVFLGLTRHWSYLTSALDLGMYDQSLWGLLNGAPFLSTIYDFGQPINRLGTHFNPILALLVPFYEIHPAAEWLVLTQALAISITAWPLYAVGVRVLSSEQGATLWTLAYLFNPFVLNAASWDFQSIALAAPLVTLAMLALEAKRVKLFLLTCALLLLVREHFGVAVAGLGVLWWLRHRTLVPGLLAVGVGGVGLFVVLGVIMPALSPSGGHVMMSAEQGALSRYDWLGTSIGEVVRTLLFSPIETLTRVLWEMGGWAYVALLSVPLALLPLVGGEFLLPAAADLAANLLSANPMPRSVFAYHSVAVVPVLIVAGMHGARRLARFDRYSVVGLGRLALFASLVAAYWLLPFPAPGATNIWEPLEYRIWPEKSVAEIRAFLPSGVSVSAQANVAPHFTQRESMRVFPRGLGEVTCVVLRLASPTARIAGNDPGEVGSLAHHLQMAPGAYLAAVREVIASEDYGVRYWCKPWLVLCRGDSIGREDQAILYSELDDVAQQWGVPPPSPGEKGRTTQEQPW